ncbi:enoyl-CoA hydratase-related protein [Shimia thalassica]|uniref:enoyl-CoA hydratase-related protein n=1 Tax=Shimia thalassica TaxID=1715693 RepID=UPI00249576F3|nr:enoyl-CoA hydratase-related protein [Shimia thalassica]
MVQAVLFEVEDNVAVLTIKSPPVNALSHAVRSGIVDGLDRALGDDDVKAVVLIGGGRTFPAGADIREFGHPVQDPWLPEVCNGLEMASKPVVAAVHGTALGGGFEVVLAAHYRIADKDARFGLPEVTLGILPGAGGTQRAPRLAGAKFALDMMLTGRPVPVTAPGAKVFFDAVVDGDLRKEAVAFAQNLISEGKGPRRTRDQRIGFEDPHAYQNEVTNRYRMVSRQQEYAPEQIIRCVEAAALLPFDQGLAFERSSFQDCLETSQSAALRHAFFAERRAGKFPELKTGQARALNTIGVIGAGGLAASVAVICLQEGWHVVAATTTVRAAEHAASEISKLLGGAVMRKHMTQTEADEALARFTTASDLVALSDADMILDCTIRPPSAKRDVFTQLDAIAKEGAVLVDAGAHSKVNLLAQATGAPGDVVALHLYAPLRVSKVAEIVLGGNTSEDTVATVISFLRKLDKFPVRAKNEQIGPRILAAYRLAADYIVEAGGTPYLVDQAMRGFGMNLGPYQALDYEGFEASLSAQGSACRASHQPDFVGRLQAAGRNGARSGKGFYLYEGKPASVQQDPEVIELIRAYREDNGIDPRGFSEDAIRYRCLAAMANEGARLLREGVARRPSDIDTVMIHAFGFPRWQGGPMKAADNGGLLHMKVELERFAREEPKFWTPDRIFDHLAKNGKVFDDLNTQ